MMIMPNLLDFEYDFYQIIYRIFILVQGNEDILLDELNQGVYLHNSIQQCSLFFCKISK
jgi:hypothetical protein